MRRKSVAYEYEADLSHPLPKKKSRLQKGLVAKEMNAMIRRLHKYLEAYDKARKDPNNAALRKKAQRQFNRMFCKNKNRTS